MFRVLLLRAVPAVLTSLGQQSVVTASAMAAAGPSKLATVIASSSQRQLQLRLRLQVHALLTTVVKCAAGLNARALRNAAAAAVAPAPAASSSSSSNRVTEAESASVTDEERAAARARLDAMLPPAVNARAAELMRQMNADSPVAPEVQQMISQLVVSTVAKMQGVSASMVRSMSADTVGQFHDTLELISGAAAAAAALGRAVSQAGATGTTTGAAGSSTMLLTAPFVSLIGPAPHWRSTGGRQQGA